MRPRWLIGVAAVVVPLAPVAARGAGNDQPYPVGEHATAMGGAAVAIVGDASAPWYNPAGLGRATAEGVSASVSVYGAHFDRTRAFYTFEGRSADLGGWTTAIFPSTVGYVRPLDAGRSDRFRHALGLSIIIPDYERHQVTLSAPDPAFALSANERLIEQTIWIVPAWGACIGVHLCVGASFAGTYRTSTGQFTYYTNGSPQNPATINALSVQEETSQVSTGLQGGLQLRITPAWSVGLYARSPTRTLLGRGKLLIVDAKALDPTPTPRRVWDDDLWTDFRLPVHLRAGAGYETDRLRLAADVHISLPQGTYASELGSTGADWVQPRATDSSPIGGPINVRRLSRRNTIVNANLGAAVTLSRRYSLRAGAFTDFSGVPEDERPDELHPRVNRFGLSLGMARTSRHSTSHFALVGAYGRGRSFSVSGDATPPRYESATVYFNMGATADFGDDEDDEQTSPATGKPLFRSWWFWALLGAAVAGGGVALYIATTRDTGVPSSDLGAQRTP